MTEEDGMDSDVARDGAVDVAIHDDATSAPCCGADSGRSTMSLALDLAGNVIPASGNGGNLSPAGRGQVPSEPTELSTEAWLAQLQLLTARSAEKAHGDPTWRGTVVLGPPLVARWDTYVITPVTGPAELVGWTVSSCDSRCRTNPVVDAASTETCWGTGRVAALSDGSVLLLEPCEIRYAEADRHSVWLMTDYGRFRAATKGIDNLERELVRHGFARVHRSFLVNLDRVRRVNHKGHGMITLSTDHRRVEGIPVSRRYTREVRALLGV